MLSRIGVQLIHSQPLKSIYTNSNYFSRNTYLTNLTKYHYSNKASVISLEILRTLKEELDRRVIGQPHATQAVVDALELHASGLGDPRLPIANLLLLGPTGTGKTELAKVLAEIIYGQRENLLQFDMPKYTNPANVSALVGTTQGYVGYEEGGLLTQPMIKNPNQVVLFDEIEKAHISILTVLLSVLGSGEIADNRGQMALFNRSIIIMTSNLCSLKMQELFKQNFTPDQIEQKLRPEFMNHLLPEFYGRITPIIFNPATETQLEHVINKMLSDVKKRIFNTTNIYIEISEDVKKYIQANGFSPSLGFRPTARFIEQKIVLPVARLINHNQIRQGQTLNITYEKSQIQFSIALNTPSTANIIQIEIQKIINLISDNDLRCINSYENLYNKFFIDMPIWSEEFVTLSLRICKICYKKNEPDLLTKAHSIFTHLSIQKNAIAMAFLGEMYLEGIGVAKDEKQALKLFTEASAFNQPLANFYLGKMHLYGFGGLDCNPYIAEQYFDKAITNGTGVIINWIGVIYGKKNSPIQANQQKIISCFKKASELGSYWGYYNLGTYYITGDVDGKVNMPKAIDCLLKAGNNGIKEAYLKLGEIYRKGLGGYPIDKKMAEHYEILGEKNPAPEDKEKVPPILEPIKEEKPVPKPEPVTKQESTLNPFSSSQLKSHPKSELKIEEDPNSNYKKIDKVQTLKFFWNNLKNKIWQKK